jgi:hypothetical protein
MVVCGGDCTRGEAWGRVGARMVPGAPSPHYRGELIYSAYRGQMEHEHHHQLHSRLVRAGCEGSKGKRCNKQFYR